MRVVLDTNVFVSALLIESSLPAQLITHWRRGAFDLLTAGLQLDELMRVTRYPKIRARLSHALAGRLINDIRELAVRIEDLPQIDLSKDPNDNYLLALASAGDADYLVSGDRSDLLDIKRFGRTRIVTVRQFASLIG